MTGVKKSVWCKFFQIEREKLHILHFLGVFAVIFGCRILRFKNPASVKEMTNMRYGLTSLTSQKLQTALVLLDSEPSDISAVGSLIQLGPLVSLDSLFHM